MSEQDYPTEEQLHTIEQWKGSLTKWFAYVKAAGHYWPEDSFGWSEEDAIDDLMHRSVHRYFISTGGWSGNEEIIGSMHENFVCWSMSWVQHRRGGHYIFEVPKEWK